MNGSILRVVLCICCFTLLNGCIVDEAEMKFKTDADKASKEYVFDFLEHFRKGDIQYCFEKIEPAQQTNRMMSKLDRFFGAFWERELTDRTLLDFSKKSEEENVEYVLIVGESYQDLYAYYQFKIEEISGNFVITSLELSVGKEGYAKKQGVKVERSHLILLLTASMVILCVLLLWVRKRQLKS